MFRLAHVTDLHFQSLEGARPSDFLNKRLLGTANLMLNRRWKHRMDLLEALREDLCRRPHDHVAVTGDLANVSLAGEWAAAGRWLDRLGEAPERVTVIPGNHDAYIEEVVARGDFERLFSAYQTADLRDGGAPYPFVRLRDGVAVVAVSTCVATGDFGAWGRVGDAQLARLERLLTSADVAARTRVVLVHHPPVMHRPPETRNLRDREALVAVLARAGADLVLHGHDHRDERFAIAGPGGAAIPVVGAGSGSYAGAPERRARYNIYEIDGRSITLATFAHDESSGAFGEVMRERLA